MSSPKDSRPVRTIKELGAENDRLTAQVEALKGALAKITERLDYLPKSEGWRSQFADSFNCDGGTWAGPGVLAALDIARAALAAVEE